MFIVRTIGIIVMCSTVFPAYLLSEKILKTKIRFIDDNICPFHSGYDR